MPIQIKEIRNYEVNEEEIQNDYETAKSLGETTAKQKLDELNYAQVVDSNTEVTEKNDYYEVKVTYQVVEDIGTKEKI